jgi:Phage integrase family
VSRLLSLHRTRETRGRETHARRTHHCNTPAPSGLSQNITAGDTMAGMRDFSDQEIDLVRKSFSGRYALRDRCYFKMALQMGLRVREMLSITVGQCFQFGKVVDGVSIERKHMKGGKASGRTIPLFPETHPHILAWLQRLAAMLKVELKDLPSETPLFCSRVRNKDGPGEQSPGRRPGVSSRALPETTNSRGRSGHTARG